MKTRHARIIRAGILMAYHQSLTDPYTDLAVHAISSRLSERAYAITLWKRTGGERDDRMVAYAYRQPLEAVLARR